MNAIKGWNNILDNESNKPYFVILNEFLKTERNNYNIFPKESDTFNAFKYTKYDDVKCVIIGQDPYHNINQAHGLAFSVNDGVKIPPSLKNIFKELQNDLNYPIPSSGNLTSWAREGVLLLNSVLTVRENTPNSHKNKGWEIFTNNIITHLNNSNKPIVFILWGNDAKRKTKLITNNIHLIITGVHPSPLSAFNGFFEKKYFSRCNDFLVSNNIKPINWKL